MSELTPSADTRDQEPDLVVAVEAPQPQDISTPELESRPPPEHDLDLIAHGDHEADHHPNLDPDHDQLNLEQQLKESIVYEKAESDPELDPQAAAQIEQRIEQLQSLADSPDHQLIEQVAPTSHDASEISPDQPSAPAPAAQPESAQPQTSTAQEEQKQKDASTKLIRLRKACDSCSIRKVKVSLSVPRPRTARLTRTVR